MSCKMHDMKQVSIRELQRNLKAILERVERGETIEVTRRRRSIGLLSPPHAADGEGLWPDLDARAADVFGHQEIAPPPSLQVASDRGET